jgi:bacteriophage protein of unknown function (DUF646)
MKETYIKFDFKELEEYAKKLKKLSQIQMGDIVKKCLYDLANRMLTRVKEETPVKEGLLRNSWQIGLIIIKKGDEYFIEVLNNVEYAEFVEYGHFQEVGKYVPVLGKRLVNMYVPGRYMMTISAQEVQDHADKYVKKILEKELRRILG